MSRAGLNPRLRGNLERAFKKLCPLPRFLTYLSPSCGPSWQISIGIPAAVQAPRQTRYPYARSLVAARQVSQQRVTQL